MENFRLDAGSSSEEDGDNNCINKKPDQYSSSLSSEEEWDDGWMIDKEKASAQSQKKKKILSRVGKIDFQRKQQKQPPVQRKRRSRSPSPQPKNGKKQNNKSNVFQHASATLKSNKSKKRNHNHDTNEYRNDKDSKKRKRSNNSITFNDDFDYMSSLMMLQQIIPPPSIEQSHSHQQHEKKSNGDKKDENINSNRVIVNNQIEDVTVLVDPKDEKNSYVLLFQDDGTESRRIGSRILNFSFGLIEDISDWTIQQVYQQLVREGAAKEAKRVQVRANDHLREIINNVRFQFQHRNISKKYLVLTDAFAVPEPKLKEGIAMKHKELISNHHKIMIREEELQTLLNELDKARKQKNELHSKLQRLEEEVNNNDNDYLSKYISSDKLQLHNAITNKVIPSKSASETKDDLNEVNHDIDMMTNKSNYAGSNDKTMVFLKPTNDNIVQNFMESFKSPYDQYN